MSTFKTKPARPFLAAVLAALISMTPGLLRADEPSPPDALPAVAEAAAAEAAPDLSDADAAQEYIDNYADNVQEDPDFKENIANALATVRRDRPAYGTFWSILPALIAILLALITKEVYSSLFLGILAGGLLWSRFAFEGTIVHVVSDGFIASIADAYNVGILVFLVLLGALVSMMNKTGASAAFGRWAATHIKSRLGAQVATIILGLLLFVDDYFNCLTVGSVMKPVSDAKKVSRAKLAYLIDATAAPICIIAPISSWAAAVAGFAKGAGADSGFSLFLNAIPWNFYAILTIVTMFFVAMTGFDFGLMRRHEDNAAKGDLFTSGGPVGDNELLNANPKGRVWDLVVPVVFLIGACVVGMIYSGGYFGADKPGFIQAFSDSDASVGLVYGSAATIVFAVAYFLCRRVISFKDCMTSLPEGFMAMVPAILILCSAWTLKTMTDSLGAKVFISQLINGPAAVLQSFLPAIIFLVAVVLAFSTGTSWGTFGILIPITLAASLSPESTIIAVSACMAGAVCGDHCSPISDTTIMASAGAGCNHVNHVNTQLPYALLVAGVSFVAYLVAPFLKNWQAALPVAIVLMLVTLFVLKAIFGRKKAAA
jgi:Na+/H+ antiporter NhaC